MRKPEHILKHEFLFIRLEGLPVPFFIEEMEVNDDQLIVKLEGLDSQEIAKSFSQKEIFLEKKEDRQKKGPLTWKELSGYTAIDSNHGTIGLIEEIIEYPMQFVAMIMKEEKEILLPLNEDLVDEVIPEEKIIHVTMPDGLFSIYLD